MDQPTLLRSASNLVSSFFPQANLPILDGIAPGGGKSGGDAGFNSTRVFLLFAIRAVVFGYVFSWAKRLWGSITHRVEKKLFPTAYISNQDPAYKWVQAWLAADASVQAQLDDFVLHTRESSKARGRDQNLFRHHQRYDDEGNNFNDDTATWESGLVLGRILPIPGEQVDHLMRSVTGHQVDATDQIIRIRFRGCWLWITRDPKANGLYGDMKISTLGYQKDALKSFLAACHSAFYAKEDHELLIFHSESGRVGASGTTMGCANDSLCNEWMDPITRPARPWSSVILPLKDAILRDMERFLSEKETKWYAARGIPHRRGYLFHGEPGAGKTTLVSALASKLRLDIYVISICQSGMDDNKLGELFRSCKPNSIILLEDIDRIFSDNQSVTTGTGLPTVLGPGIGPLSPPGTPFVIAPSRNGNGDEDTASVPEGGDDAPNVVKRDASVVTMSGLLNAIDGVSSQEGCLLIASTNHPDKLDPALTRAGRFDVRVPFHSATPEQARNLFTHFFPAEDFQTPPDPLDPLNVLLEKPLEPAPPILTQADLDGLAVDYAAAVFPDGAEGGAGGVSGAKVAMASMQAYLLNFKESPREAVKQAGEWARSAEKGALLLTSPTIPELV